MSVTADSSSTAAQGHAQQQQQQHKASSQAHSQADPAVAGDHSAAKAPAKPAAQQTQKAQQAQAVKQAATAPARAPTHQSQGQQQQQPKQSVAKPAAAAKLGPAAAKPRLLPLTELPTREARFDAGRDELRYSLRSLEMHLPWYRHLYIVTNGQVGSYGRVRLLPCLPTAEGARGVEGVCAGGARAQEGPSIYPLSA